MTCLVFWVSCWGLELSISKVPIQIQRYLDVTLTLPAPHYHDIIILGALWAELALWTVFLLLFSALRACDTAVKLLYIDQSMVEINGWILFIANLTVWYHQSCPSRVCFTFQWRLIAHVHFGFAESKNIEARRNSNNPPSNTKSSTSTVSVTSKLKHLSAPVR